MRLSVSMTTRMPRMAELDGKDYIFVSKPAFMETISRGGFLEYAEVYGNYYGTPRDPVNDMLASGEDVMLEIDVQGALKVKESCPGGVFIFVLPPSMRELRKRIRGRGTETDEDIELRLSETICEIERMTEYDYCIVNGKLDDAADRLAAIVTAENSRIRNGASEMIRSYRDEV